MIRDDLSGNTLQAARQETEDVNAAVAFGRQQDDCVLSALADPSRHPATVYLARLSPGSRRTQAAAPETIARLASGDQLGAGELPWAELRYQHTQLIRAALAQRYAPSTVNRHLAALRGVLRGAWRLGLMNSEHYHRAADLPSIPGSRLPAGRSLSGMELLRLFEACALHNGPSGARDAALLALLYGCGLRDVPRLSNSTWVTTSEGEIQEY